jgi:hypothetical protein
MCNFKLLVVEDDEGALQTYRDTIGVYTQKTGCQIDLKICKNEKEAFAVLDSSFDGAIIDLKLGADPVAGNKVIDSIFERFRIPTAIMTGTPANAVVGHPYVIVCKKGEVGYEELLNNFLEVYKTGITKILGGRGQIERAMQQVFCNNILPQLDTWKSYAKKGKQTEKALLRFTLNHLMELLEEDEEFCFTEEMYIAPPISSGIKTGSIVKKKDVEEHYIILSPSCDLTIRQNGACNTDHYLLCKIENFEEIKTLLLSSVSGRKDKGNKLCRLLANNQNNYYHWLPKGHGFLGGIINFRHCMTMTKADFNASFDGPKLQVSKHFIKDIVSRYSSYYARQGQPDFDCESIANAMLDNN